MSLPSLLQMMKMTMMQTVRILTPNLCLLHLHQALLDPSRKRNPAPRAQMVAALLLSWKSVAFYQTFLLSEMIILFLSKVKLSVALLT